MDFANTLMFVFQIQVKQIKINEPYSIPKFCTNVTSYITICICKHDREGLRTYKTDVSQNERRLPIQRSPKITESNRCKKSFPSYLETLFLFEEVLTILSLQNRWVKALFYFGQGLQKVKDLCQVCRRHVSGFHSHSFSHHKSCIFRNCLLV